MYDQFEAAAEADLVRELRSQGGDAFAIQTMRNHWAGYIPDDALDVVAAFGVTHARIPVGYWIVDTPVGEIARRLSVRHIAAVWFPQTRNSFSFQVELLLTTLALTTRVS